MDYNIDKILKKFDIRIKCNICGKLKPLYDLHLYKEFQFQPVCTFCVEEYDKRMKGRLKNE